MAESIQLSGATADSYLAVLRGLVRAARAGAQLPDGRRIDTHLSFLGPGGSRGVQEGVHVDACSGLPTLREWLRVRADRDLAEGFLRDNGDRLPAKAAYYRSLPGAELVPLSSLDVRLRGRARGAARFEVTHDRIDAASGCLVRYTVLLELKGGRLVGLERGDLSEPTERFRAVVERYSGADAELALLLMSELPGAKVEEVTRGQLGPLSFAGVATPPLIARVLEANPGAFVLHLALERAGACVEKDLCRDPFSELYRDALGPEARAQVEERQKALGYGVFKERRLVCTPAAEQPLRAALAAAGAKVIVRSG